MSKPMRWFVSQIRGSSHSMRAVLRMSQHSMRSLLRDPLNRYEPSGENFTYRRCVYGERGRSFQYHTYATP